MFFLCTFGCVNLSLSAVLFSSCVCKRNGLPRDWVAPFSPPTLLLSQWEFSPWEIWVAFPKEMQPQQSHYPTLINYKVHAGSFFVSVIHNILTWTTGSLKKRTWSFLRVRICTRGVGGTPTASQHDNFDSEKLSQIALVLLTGFEPRIFGSWVPMLYPLSHPVTRGPATSTAEHLGYPLHLQNKDKGQ